MQAVVIQNTQRFLCELNLSSDSLHLSGDIQLSWPLPSVNLSVGGNNDSLLFFQNTDDPETQLYIELNGHTLKTLSQNSVIKNKLEPLKLQTGWVRHKTTVLTVAILGSMLAMLLLSRNYWSAALAQTIPFSLEQKAYKNFSWKNQSEPQRAASLKLEEWTSKLMVNTAEWPHAFIYHFDSDSTPNAFATLGGNITVNSGLVSLTDDPRELLAVIAHEMTHVRKRHVIKSVIQATGVYGVTSMVFGDLIGASTVLIDSGSSLINLSYSRELEEEADAEAITLLERSGIDPEYLALVFEKMQKYYDSLMPNNEAGKFAKKIGELEILSTHPGLPKRIERIRQHKKQISAVVYEPNLIKYQQFKAEVARIF